MGKEKECFTKKTKKPRILAWECLEDGCPKFPIECPGFKHEKKCRRLEFEKLVVTSCLQDLCWYRECPRIFPSECWINNSSSPTKL